MKKPRPYTLRAARGRASVVVKTVSKKWDFARNVARDVGLLYILLSLVIGLYIVASQQSEILAILERQEVTAAEAATAEDEWGSTIGPTIRSAYTSGFLDGLEYNGTEPLNDSSRYDDRSTP